MRGPTAPRRSGAWRSRRATTGSSGSTACRRDQVAPSPEDLVRIEAEARLIAAAKARDSAAPGVAGAFVWPVTGRDQRRLRQSAHPEWRAAPAASRGRRRRPVRHAGRGDGGWRDLAGRAGDVLHWQHGDDRPRPRPAQPLRPSERDRRRGRAAGAAGRDRSARSARPAGSTGPHLHWGVFWFERALDPALLVGPMPRP